MLSLNCSRGLAFAPAPQGSLCKSVRCWYDVWIDIHQASRSGTGSRDSGLCNAECELLCGAAQVISTSGNTHLGREDSDHRVMDYFMKLTSLIPNP